MTANEDKPVDREAWRRLLEGDGERPPELTDARIRAKARQAIAPRTGRWWLPASLAASLLLAVLLVQRQYDRPAAPAIVSESDYAMGPAEAPAPSRRDETAPDAALMDAPEVAAVAERPVAPAAPEREQQTREFVPPPPVVPPPLVNLPAVEESRVASAAAESRANAPAADATAGYAAPADAALANAAPAQAPPAAQAKREEEEDVGEIVVTGSRRRQGSLESSTPVTQVTSADVAARSQGATGALVKSTDVKRSPEEWYAEIEKLRAAGKKRAAKRELEKLEAAHPGWLEEHLKQLEPPKE